MAASSAVDVFPRRKYDVFLSFRGLDTRHKFTSHLYAALDRKKIYTYIDDRLERGDEIGPALLTAIEQSNLSVIIFSKDYASSSWCLDEVVHILKCKREYGQLVIPVFYDIDPSHVRKQQGTYEDAFAILEDRFKDNMDKVRKWRQALTTAANLSGVHSQNIRLESELIDIIVTDISTKLNRNSSYTMKGLVGMENHIQQIELLLCINAQDVCHRTICIWGMGGIGKTTLADAVFHRNSSEFDACLFLANVREESEKHGLNHLRNELLRGFLEEANLSIGSPSIGSTYVIDRLSRTKVLVVFDDVSDLDQLEFLLGNQIQFGPGSRIIITTRNRRLLKKRVPEDHIYKVNELSVGEALQLFQSIAFADDSCITDYSNLSRKVVDYAGCNPLALKVLASSFLHCNNRQDWEEELNKLKKFPNPKIQNVLRISYDGLGENEKGIFLDIACFLKGEDICDAKRILELHGFCASRGVAELIDRSLISIKNNNSLEMHDLLQEMGRAIERGIEEPGKRKRLWNAEDAYRVFNNNTGSSTVEAIFLDVSKIQELQLSPAAFGSMQNLKLLKFYVPQEVHNEYKRQRRWTVGEKQQSSFPWLPGVKAVRSFLAKSRIWGSITLLDVYRKVCNYDDEVFRKYCNVYLRGGLESLPEELRYLYWDGCPLKSLPSQYSPHNLVELHMPNSQVRQLWTNGQNLMSLKHLNLRDSRNLIEVPDLSGSPNIERIDLRKCTSLVRVPSYFQNLENLASLDLDDCVNLKFVCEIPCNLEVLNLSETAIEEISPSIWSHKKLHTLDLSCCKNLKNLPSRSNSTTGCGGQNQIGLKILRLDNSNIESLPGSSIYGLDTVDLYGCKQLKRLPPLSLGSLCCWTSLDLSWCTVLESIPDSLFCSSTLQRIDLSFTMIESIPSSIINASGLLDVLLLGCKKLKVIPELPLQLQSLDASGCTSLKRVASSRSALVQQPWEHGEGYIWPERRVYTDCLELDESARSNIMGDAHLRIMRMASSSSKRKREEFGAFIAIWPGNEIPGWFSYDYQWEGCELNHIQFPTTKTTGKEKGPMKEICLNFVVSAVVVVNSEYALPSIFPSLSLVLVCDCNFKTNNDGKGYRRRITSPEFSGPTHRSGVTFEEDHVVTFLQRDVSFLCEENSITQVSFHVYPRHDDTSNGPRHLFPKGYFDRDRDEGKRIKVKKWENSAMHRLVVNTHDMAPS